MISKIKSLSQNKDVKKLSVNFLSLFSVQGLNMLLPLITLPYLFRVLGAEKFGLIAFAFSTIAFFRVFVDYGFQLYATREISQNANNKNKIKEIFNTILSAKLLLLFCSFLLLNILVFFFEKFASEWLLFYLTFLFVIGQAMFPVWFFQGVEDMKYIGYLNLYSKIFFTIGIFIFIQEESDYILQPLFNGLGIIFIAIYSLYIIKKKYNIAFKFQSFHKIQIVLKESFNLFIANFLPNMYYNFSTFFLGFFTSMENVGYYSLATKLIDVLNSIVTILRNVTFPYLNKSYSKFYTIAKVMILSGLFLSISLFATSHFFIPLIFGDKGYEALIYIYLLGFGPLLLSIKSSFGANKMVILGYDKLYKDIVLIYSIIGFILALILIPLFEAIGSAITVISTWIIMALLYYIKAKNLKEKHEQ